MIKESPFYVRKVEGTFLPGYSQILGFLEKKRMDRLFGNQV